MSRFAYSIDQRKKIYKTTTKLNKNIETVKLMMMMMTMILVNKGFSDK